MLAHGILADIKVSERVAIIGARMPKDSRALPDEVGKWPGRRTVLKILSNGPEASFRAVFVSVNSHALLHRFPEDVCCCGVLFQSLVFAGLERFPLVGRVAAIGLPIFDIVKSGATAGQNEQDQGDGRNMHDHSRCFRLHHRTQAKQV